MTKCKVSQGILYFPKYELARKYAKELQTEFPNIRPIEYQLGYALQIEVSGDYIGPNMRPSMENAMRAFDAASYSKENVGDTTS